MELSIRLECPQCSTALPLPFDELTLGRRRLCDLCQTPVLLTADSLDRFTEDMHRFCQS